MEEVVTVADTLTTQAHPTLFLHQVAELSEEEQVEKLNRAFFNCYQQIKHQPVVLKGLFCNRTWDNVMCWPDTAAGTVGYQRCPFYINGFDHAEYATKHCLENGTWYTSTQSGKAWTNYTPCYAKGSSSINDNLPPLIVEHMPGIKLMYTIGYTLSLAALILAVSIMIYFRRLHCARNMIHLNMFLAFLVRAAFSLIRTVLLVQDLGFPNDVNNTGERIVFKEGVHWECKMFFTLFYYIIFASVMWLFNEGLYLVLILSVSVFVEKTKIRWFVLLGWGVPFLFVIPWVICRVKLDDMLCWNVHVKKNLFWILRGPMIASVAVNFAFFIVIIRMLFSKLTAAHCPESKKVRYRKLAKSTLILIPLFAVYYMGFIWLPDGLSPASDLFKLYVEMLFNSFQGFLVALLFCFLNAEVQREIRKKWHVLRRRGSWRSMPSNGSFLRRSGTNNKDAIRRNSQSRSFLDSTVSTRDQHLPNAATAAAAANTNGNMTPICEESAPLTDSTVGSGGGTHIPLCLRQDFNDNHTHRKEGEVSDTGFSGDVLDSHEDVTVGGGSSVHSGENSDLLQSSSAPRDDDDVLFDTVSGEEGQNVPNDIKANDRECISSIVVTGQNGDVTRGSDVGGKCDVEVHKGELSSSSDIVMSYINTDKSCIEDECDSGVTKS
ncbi:hypothetical protein ACOMHN_036124 [Nucella lapillus]